MNTATPTPETTLPAPADTDPWANASDSSGAVTGGTCAVATPGAMAANEGPGCGGGRLA